MDLIFLEIRYQNIAGFCALFSDSGVRKPISDGPVAIGLLRPGQLCAVGAMEEADSYKLELTQCIYSAI